MSFLVSPEALGPPSLREVSALRILLVAVARAHEVRFYRAERALRLVAPAMCIMFDAEQEPVEARLSASLRTWPDRTQQLTMRLGQEIKSEEPKGGMLDKYVFRWNPQGMVIAHHELGVLPSSDPVSLDDLNLDNIYVPDDIVPLLHVEQDAKTVTKGDCTLLAASIGQMWGIADPREVLVGR